MSTLNRASAGMPRTNGPRYLTIGEAMTDFSSTSTARSRTIPAFSASATASLNASICTASPRFVAIFIVTASPSSPTWVIVGPIAMRSPRTFSSAAGSPPTMNESWPASSVTGLPDTGASIKAAPRSATARPSSRVTSGLTVLISAQTAPGRSPAITPSGPSAIARSAVLSVTMLKTASAASATARGDFSSTRPAATRARAFSGVRL